MKGWRTTRGVLGSCSNPRTCPIGLNLIHSPSGQNMARQHLADSDASLFRRFPWSRKAFGCETISNGYFILLSFHLYKERPKRSWYVIWVMILVWSIPKIRIGFQLDLDWDSNLAWPPLLLLCPSTSLFKPLLIFSIVSS